GLYNINSLLYEEIKDYPNALKYLKISHQIQDSLTTDAAHKQLNELQVKYDLNALNNEKTMLEVKNKQTLLISLSILLIIVISICTYLYFSLKKEKRMKMELKVLHGKAQESEKMKQAFINSICHEIRTPLNAIVGFSDLIMNEDIDAEMRREFPAEIQKSTVLLTGLVNSMLEVANLDVSEEKLPCEAADLKDICTQEMELLNKKPGIEYILDIAPESMIIQTNVQYLTQVIGHLLNNANKFTEKGCITLSYEADKQQKHISISVTDTGCGIPKEKYEEVFNRFSKLDTFVPGNGLGLYLCRLIVKRLAGEIKIDPSYAEGTRMVVTLPIH
ncbi:MAG: sensor histidine kinase, partial [Bacteroides oleiciplenus]|nr:sensor histidine kinase [Bacteroides oleiciplenus]